MAVEIKDLLSSEIGIHIDDLDIPVLKGDKGDKGEKGDKPIVGVDYYTEIEKNEFKNAIVKDSKEDIQKHAANKIEEYDNNATERIKEYNTNASNKINEYDENANKLLNKLLGVETEIKKDIEKKVDKIEGKELSSNDFTDGYKQKLDNLENYDDTQIKKYISDIEEEQITQNTDISNIKKEQETQNTNIEENNSKIVELQTEKAKLETELKEMKEDFYQNSIRGQASGEYIHVEDSSNCRAKIGINGNHEQETSTQTENYVDDRKARGKTISQATSLYLPIVNLKAGDNYYLKIFDKDNQLLQDSRYLAVEFYDANKTKIQDGPLGFPKSFTEEAVTKIKYAKIYYNGNDTDKAIGNAVIKKIGLKITSNASADDIDLFVPNMPSTDYLSDIKTVGSNGSVKVTKCNKNLLETKTTFEENGIKVTANADGTLKITGTTTGAIHRTIMSNIVNCQQGKTYTKWVKVNGTIEKNGKNVFITGRSTCDYKNYFGDTSISSNKIDYCTTTVNKTIPIDFIALYIAEAGVKFDCILQIMLYEGNTIATAFEQHKEQSYIMPVQQEMLEGDYFDWDNEEEVHVWGNVIVNGTETINKNSNSEFFSITKSMSQFDTSANAIKQSIANYGAGTTLGLGSGNTNNKYSFNSSTIYLDCYNSNINTVEKLKVQLTKNNMKIYAKLATPQRIAFTDEQKAVAKELNNARTYKNVTNITTDSKAILSLDYVKDQETQNQKMQNEIDEIKQLLSTTQTSAMLLDNLQKEVESEVE